MTNNIRSSFSTLPSLPSLAVAKTETKNKHSLHWFGFHCWASGFAIWQGWVALKVRETFRNMAHHLRRPPQQPKKAAVLFLFISTSLSFIFISKESYYIIMKTKQNKPGSNDVFAVRLLMDRPRESWSGDELQAPTTISFRSVWPRKIYFVWLRGCW